MLFCRSSYSSHSGPRVVPSCRRAAAIARALGDRQLAKSKTSELDDIVRWDGSRTKDDTYVTIVERFLLMSLSRDDGVPASLPHMAHDVELAGAILIDLMLYSRIRFQRGCVELTDGAPTGYAFLDPVLQKIEAESKPMELGEWLELLAEDSSDLKHAAFERLADRGLVAVERRALVSGFEAHFFPHTKDSGKESLVARIACDDVLDPADVLAVCLANACGLFDVILSKKRKKRLAKRIRQLVDTNVVGKTMIEAVETASRASRQDVERSIPATTSKQSRQSKKANKWEWRAFWSARRPVVTPGDAAGLDGSVEFKATNVSDRYLLIPERRDNIKMRKNGLEVKQLIESHRHYEAFRPKKVLKFPIEADDLARIFPRLYGASVKVSDKAELEAALHTHGYVPTHVDVEKVRNRVRLVDDVLLEFCEFRVGNGTHWSVCVEGPDFGHVRAWVHTINPQAGQVMGYMDYLHRMVGEEC